MASATGDAAHTVRCRQYCQCCFNGACPSQNTKILKMYSEILQDAVFSLIKIGKVSQASGCAFTPSPNVWQMYKEILIYTVKA